MKASGALLSRVPLDLAKHTQRAGTPVIIPERCKECRFCVELCPKDVLSISRSLNKKGYHPPEVTKGKEQACIACHFCEHVCPDFAIFVQMEPVS